MSAAGSIPEESESNAPGVELPPSQDRHAQVAAVAGLFQSVLAGLQDVDFGETPPAAAYTAGGGSTDAAL